MSFSGIYLYIKQHSVTGKLYFGKTVQNPETYPGSGKHWRRHVDKHGKEHIVTLWYCMFLDQESCTEFALNFSAQQDIVKSSEWLNLVVEDGMDGGNRGGHKHTPESRRKLSEARMGIVFSDAHKQKLSEKKKKAPVTIEGTFYDGIMSASKALGIDYQVVKYRVNHKTKWSDWMRLL